MPQQVEVAVLGMGAMGSATALSLALRGVRVAGFEQYGIAHALGSSHGDVRIIRKAYFEHPDYVPLLEASYGFWQRLAELSEKSLLVKSGILMCAPPGSATLQGLEAGYAGSELPHEHLMPEELLKRWPHFNCPPGFEGFFDPEGGYLFVEDCVEQALLAAQRHGAELHLHEAVLDWRPKGSGVELVTDQRTLQAERLILCAGPWSARDVQGLALPLQVVRKVQLWYELEDLASYQPPEFPAFFFECSYGSVYGFPHYGENGLKLAEHSGGELIAGPEGLDRRLRAEDELAVKQFLSEVLRQPNAKLTRFSACMYTRTPDEHFILDQHPEYPQICIAAGFSGHGFKFASVVGEIMADLALEGATRFPIEFLRAGRFTASPGA